MVNNRLVSRTLSFLRIVVETYGNISVLPWIKAAYCKKMGDLFM